MVRTVECGRKANRGKGAVSVILVFVLSRPLFPRFLSTPSRLLDPSLILMGVGGGGGGRRSLTVQ